ncbi:NRDE family protein [Horticoccus sp. 23ND18S-11]|uniref:hypothetical protein n=1 Tax=Horticoccus sp. 23ND18S-11 TaxID=3391832 RepID=UPI0039C9C9BF
MNTRAPETPPGLARTAGVSFVAPRDGEHGGTWLLANEFGLTICLLNDYGSAWHPSAAGARFSRGHVVVACAGANAHASVYAIVDRQPLRRTPAFHLVALSPEEGLLVLHWDGTTLARRTRSVRWPILSSSSYATAAIIAKRTACFGAMMRSPRAPAVEELASFHRQHERDGGAHSVLMRRPDAATRSITHVSVRAGVIGLSYAPVRWVTGEPEVLGPVQVRLRMRRRAPLAA